MKRLLARNIIPHRLSSKLWGDRAQWGLLPNELDPCWKEWQNTFMDFYVANQREGIGIRINDAGYRVMRRIELSGKVVLEIGPGDIRHVAFWKTTPKEYILADIQDAMLEKAAAKLAMAGIASHSLHVSRGQPLALTDASVDVIVSFYSLEHIYPLQPYLQELKRVLKPGGILAGAIPAEGGLAWGLGRMLTSRRWFKKHTQIDPDKIICWEHPNFGDDIVQSLDHTFDRKQVEYWPLPWLPHPDINLLIRYVYQKSG